MGRFWGAGYQGEVENSCVPIVGTRWHGKGMLQRGEGKGRKTMRSKAAGGQQVPRGLGYYWGLFVLKTNQAVFAVFYCDLEWHVAWALAPCPTRGGTFPRDSPGAGSWSLSLHLQSLWGAGGLVGDMEKLLGVLRFLWGKDWKGVEHLGTLSKCSVNTKIQSFQSKLNAYATRSDLKLRVFAMPWFSAWKNKGRWSL